MNQLNDALAFIQEHADEFSVDTTEIVLAGDSAGAQLASELATLVTSPRYAALAGIEPSLGAAHDDEPSRLGRTRDRVCSSVTYARRIGRFACIGDG